MISRRMWWLGIGIILPFLGQADVSTCGQEGKDFPCWWNEWVRRRTSRQAGGVDVVERELWLEVKKMWKKVEKEVEKEYAG